MSIADKLLAIAENEQKVYEAGKKAEHKEFWDVVQENGSRTDYDEAFANSGIIWSSVNLKPKYNMICTSANKMFYGYNDVGDRFSLSEILAKQGIVLDVSQATDVGSMFGYCRTITEIPTIDISNATTSTQIFNFCMALVTIEKLIVTKDNTFNNTFNRCDSLKNLTIQGTIGQNGLNFSRSPLSHDSLMSIINALEDKTGDTSEAWAVTFGASNIGKLTTDEQLTAESKGWALN